MPEEKRVSEWALEWLEKQMASYSWNGFVSKYIVFAPFILDLPERRLHCSPDNLEAQQFLSVLNRLNELERPPPISDGEIYQQDE